MPGCQRCWNEAGRAAHYRGIDKVEEYHRLIQERTGDLECTPEQQCGEMHLVLEWKDGGKRCMCGAVVEKEADRE